MTPMISLALEVRISQALKSILSYFMLDDFTINHGLRGQFVLGQLSMLGWSVRLQCSLDRQVVLFMMIS